MLNERRSCVCPSINLDLKNDVSAIKSTELCDLLVRSGSNKADHGYSHIYNYLLSDLRHSLGSVLEIGIGTQDASIPSTMNLNEDMRARFAPGGSLRAWAEYFPGASITGVDIDIACLFEEPRISTIFANQGDVIGLHAAASRYAPFDLIVDDGVHTLGPTFSAFCSLIPLLKQGGYYIIEDMHVEYLPVLRHLIATYVAAASFRGYTRMELLLTIADMQEFTTPSNQCQNMVVMQKL